MADDKSPGKGDKAPVQEHNGIIVKKTVTERGFLHNKTGWYHNTHPVCKPAVR